MRDNPEHIFYDYLYEGIENEILACDNELCDIQFFTNRTRVDSGMHVVLSKGVQEGKVWQTSADRWKRW